MIFASMRPNSVHRNREKDGHQTFRFDLRCRREKRFRVRHDSAEAIVPFEVRYGWTPTRLIWSAWI